MKTIVIILLRLSGIVAAYNFVDSMGLHWECFIDSMAEKKTDYLAILYYGGWFISEDESVS